MRSLPTPGVGSERLPTVPRRVTRQVARVRGDDVRSIRVDADRLRDLRAAARVRVFRSAPARAALRGARLLVVLAVRPPLRTDAPRHAGVRGLDARDRAAGADDPAAGRAPRAVQQ